MSVRSGICSLVCLCLLTGCTVMGSVAPIVSESDALFDQRLVGTWAASDGSEAAAFTRDSASGYEIVYTDDQGKVGRFEGRLGRVGGRLVLDMSPVTMELDVADVYGAFLLPLHTPIFIDSIGETLVWRVPEPDSLKALFGRSPRVAAHELRGDLIVLTAGSPEVRRVVADVARRPGFLSEAETWMRRRP